MTAVVVALGMAVAVLGVLVVGLLRSHADVLRALHDLGVGEDSLGGSTPTGARSRASAAAAGPGSGTRVVAGDDPDIRTVPGVPSPGPNSALGRLVDVDGVDPHGGAVRIGLQGARSSTLLAFLSTGCSTCADFWQAFDTDEIRRVPGDDTRVVVVTHGPEDESPAGVAGLAPRHATTVMSSAAWDDYDVPVSPYFVLLDGAHGVVGEGAAATWDQVVDLLGKAAADAGLAAGASGALTRRELLGGRGREDRADRELSAAGIEPGSPDLYQGLDGLTQDVPDDVAEDAT